MKWHRNAWRYSNDQDGYAQLISPAGEVIPIGRNLADMVSEVAEVSRRIADLCGEDVDKPQNGLR